MKTGIGKLLIKLRLDYGHYQGDMAKILGVSQAFLSKVENGQAMPPLNWIEKLEKAYYLNKEETEKLRNTITNSRICSPRENIINISNLEVNDQELIILFAKNINKISGSNKDVIKRMLKKL